MLMREPGRGGVGVRSWRSEKEVIDRGRYYVHLLNERRIDREFHISQYNEQNYLHSKDQVGEQKCKAWLNATSAPNEKEKCKSRITCMILFHPTNVTTTCTKQTIS
jgi:hypothetical protein